MRTLKLTVMALALLVAASGYAAEDPIPKTCWNNTGNDGTPVVKDGTQPKIAKDQAQTVMSSGVAIIPSSKSPSYGACLAKLEAFLETGVMPSGNATNDPTVFLLPDRILPEYLMESTTASLWYGNLNTTLVNERGNIAVFWLIVQNPQGLRLADQRITESSSDTYNGQPQNSLGAVLRMDGINYSSRAVGIDGSTRVTSGPPSQVVKRLYYTGFGNNYICDTPAQINGIRAYILERLPFTITARWDSLNGSISVANVVVQLSTEPKPAPNHSLAIRNVGQGMVQVSVIGNPWPGPYATIWSSSTLSGVYTNYATVLGASTITLPSTNRMKFFR